MQVKPLFEVVSEAPFKGMADEHIPFKEKILQNFNIVGWICMTVSIAVLLFVCSQEAAGDATELSMSFDESRHWGHQHILKHKQLIVSVDLFTFAIGAFVATCPARATAVLKAVFVRTDVLQALYAFGVCAVFMVIGPALMILNKDIMQKVGFNYPLSLSLIGLLSSAIFSRIIVGLGLASVRPQSLEVVAGSRWYRTALPISVCKALTLASGNAVYLHLGLGFIQMLKAFTPTIVLIVLRISGVSKPSRAAAGFVSVIVLGTMLEVKGELQASMLGLVLMFSSEFTEALNMVFTQKLLQNEKFTVIETMYVLAPPGALFLLVFAILTEWSDLISKAHYVLLLEYPFSFSSAAVIGVAVNFVGFMVVQATSSLTAKILNTARGTGLVLIGVFFYGEKITPIEMVGYAIAIFGVLGYNLVQVAPEQGAKLEKQVERICSLPRRCLDRKVSEENLRKEDEGASEAPRWMSA